MRVSHSCLAVSRSGHTDRMHVLYPGVHTYTHAYLCRRANPSGALKPSGSSGNEADLGFHPDPVCTQCPLLPPNKQCLPRPPPPPLPPGPLPSQPVTGPGDARLSRTAVLGHRPGQCRAEHPGRGGSGRPTGMPSPGKQLRQMPADGLEAARIPEQSLGKSCPHAHSGPLTDAGSHRET